MGKGEHSAEGIGPAQSAADRLTATAEKVCLSRTFANAESLRRLLLYLAKRTVESAETPPKEYEIATEVLDRPRDFDPRTDSAVRVVTSRLRSKLIEYYSGEGRHDTVVVELRRGLYSLQLREAESVPVIQAFHETPLRRRRISVPLLAALVTLPLVAASVAFQLGRHAATSGGSVSWSPAMESFWQPYLSGGKPTVVVLGTAMTLRFSNGVHLRDHRINDADQAALSERARQWEKALQAQSVPSYRYTGVGEATGSFLIAQLLGPRLRNLVLRRSSAFPWDALRSSNVIFLGAPKWNAQIKELPIEQDFTFTPDGGTIVNRRPRRGEPTGYLYGMPKGPKSDDLLDGYALITRLSDLPGYGSILALCASSTEGAWAATEYVSQAENVEDLFRHVRTPDGRWPSSFQVVIQAKFNSLVPVALSYVTHHELTTAAAVH